VALPISILILQGTRQGGLSSAQFYLVYVNKLIDILSNSGIGAYKYNCKTSCPTVADDMILVAFSRKALQETHLDLDLLCDEFMSSSPLIDNSAKTLRDTFGLIINCGFTPGKTNPLTPRNIYCNVVLPKTLYGALLWSNYSRTDMCSLEIAHRNSLKQMQILSTSCDTTFSVVSLEIDALEEIVDFNKLQFLDQPCRLSSDPNSKQVFIHRLIRHLAQGDVVFGFIPDICRIAKKYNRLK